MALIDCTECGKQISSLAASCPNCGAPLAPQAPPSEKDVVTTQATAKQYKLLQLCGVAIVISGFVVMIAAKSPGYGALLLAAGVGLYIYGRASAWWYHG